MAVLLGAKLKRDKATANKSLVGFNVMNFARLERVKEVTRDLGRSLCSDLERLMSAMAIALNHAILDSAVNDNLRLHLRQLMLYSIPYLVVPAPIIFINKITNSLE